MDGLDRATGIWFAGDLDDPWVASIAEALPRDSFRIDCPGLLPETWPMDSPTPSVLVVHRSNLTPTDAQRVVRLKSRADRTPRSSCALARTPATPTPSGGRGWSMS